MAEADDGQPHGSPGSAGRRSLHGQHWEVVHASDGADAVAVGDMLIPLDVVSAGEMPGLAARLRIDNDETHLQSLYTTQVRLPLCPHCHLQPGALLPTLCMC